ncbi:hypothetical protein C5C03_00235 [Clavibacter michiganensis]|nr:hypothetical protein C5C03_00235 [Clavibacter michiganensis]PPF99331.1 hypothetical protein C5C05_02040 [Clavibacter michiganensis]
MVFLAVILLEVVLFAVARQGAHAPDLAGQFWDLTGRAYSTVAAAYLAYIAFLLLPHLRAGMASTNHAAQSTSALRFAGFALAIVRFALGLVTFVMPAAYYVGQAVSGAAVFVAMGLATAFFSRILRKRRAAQAATSARRVAPVPRPSCGPEGDHIP